MEEKLPTTPQNDTEKHLITRGENKTSMVKGQQSFIKHRSTVDATFTIRQLDELKMP